MPSSRADRIQFRRPLSASRWTSIGRRSGNATQTHSAPMVSTRCFSLPRRSSLPHWTRVKKSPSRAERYLRSNSPRMCFHQAAPRFSASPCPWVFRETTCRWGLRWMADPARTRSSWAWLRKSQPSSVQFCLPLICPQTESVNERGERDDIP
jgi:hypothetical protein